MKRITLLVAAVLALPLTAQAADSATGTVAVTGVVPTLCAMAPLSDDGGLFDLGTLVDTTTGFLRTDLGAPSKVLTASFCNARSTINLSAERMTAQGFTSAPPTGFSRGVDFTATAAGWTPAAAVYSTGAASNPQAIQSRDSAHAGDIVVSLSGFATQGGATLRPVADSEYRGQVVVTLAVAD